jgi:hypothetical protein
MTTPELLNEYQRILKAEGPDSDAAYDLLLSHLDATEFIHLAEGARQQYVQRRQVIRFLLICGPVYFGLAAAFLSMIWFG